MNKATLALVTLLAGTLALSAASAPAETIFKNRCSICHTTQESPDKSKLMGPPADEVMYHVKERFPQKNEAVEFMVDYIMEPSVKKALCASMDKFGMMPAMKGTITPEDATAVSEMMFEKFPRPDFTAKEKKDRSGVTFERIDANGDGFVSPEEFRAFRAKRNGIDPKSMKHDLYFKKIDLNGDGKMDKEEFKAMKKARQGA